MRAETNNHFRKFNAHDRNSGKITGSEGSACCRRRTEETLRTKSPLMTKLIKAVNSVTPTPTNVNVY